MGKITIATGVLLTGRTPFALVNTNSGTMFVHTSKTVGNITYTYYTNVLTGMNYISKRDYNLLCQHPGKNEFPRPFTILSSNLFVHVRLAPLIQFLDESEMLMVMGKNNTDEDDARIISKILGNSTKGKKPFTRSRTIKGQVKR